MADATHWNIAPKRAEHIASMASTEARPIDDHRSTASYRRHAVAVLTKRLLERSNNV
jgi:CO/xanthine dehydrogenase FAD-binding subunit